MEELLGRMCGAKVDITCSNGAAVRGEVTGIANGVLSLKGDDGRIGYVSLERISAVWETKDSGNGKPGFVG